MKIQADNLVVRDKDKMATFTGNVHVIQGDTEMRSKVLVVFYVDTSKPGAGAGHHHENGPARCTPGPASSR